MYSNLDKAIVAFIMGALQLVNMLLEFSRIESGRAQAACEPTDLAGFTADLASMYRSPVERAGLRLIVDCPPLPGPALVDRQVHRHLRDAIDGHFEPIAADRDGAPHGNERTERRNQARREAFVSRHVRDGPPQWLPVNR